MKREVKELIKKVVKELRKIDGIKAIYLFGSYAKGTEKPISDIDICVITEKNIPLNKKEEIISNSGRKVQISLFWDLPVSIRYNVLKEGKSLFQKDESFLHKISVNTLKEYLDIKPMLKRFAKLYLSI